MSAQVLELGIAHVVNIKYKEVGVLVTAVSDLWVYGGEYNVTEQLSTIVSRFFSKGRERNWWVKIIRIVNAKQFGNNLVGEER